MYTRNFVGWSTSNRLTRELATRALEMAIDRQVPDAGLMAHSERGSEYASADYERLLSEHGIRYSMSRKGNCGDNAPMESFFATLRTELVHAILTSNLKEVFRRPLCEYQIAIRFAG